MADNQSILAHYRRFADLISAALVSSPPPAFSPETSTSLRIERGAAFASSVLGKPGAAAILDPFVRWAASERLTQTSIVDQNGHSRPEYPGLLAYAAMATFALEYERLSPAEFGRWDESLRSFSTKLESSLSGKQLPRGLLPGGAGASDILDIALKSLALFVAGKIFICDAWTDLAGDSFGHILRCQQPSGAFFPTQNFDHPEIHWFHEMVLLHATASYAVRAGDRAAGRAVLRATEFHLNEIQPDHATHQPWALFAYIWNSKSHTLAEQLLHTFSVSQARGCDGISLILLADALYCLRLFL